MTKQMKTIFISAFTSVTTVLLTLGIISGISPTGNRIRSESCKAFKTSFVNLKEKTKNIFK